MPEPLIERAELSAYVDARATMDDAPQPEEMDLPRRRTDHPEISVVSTSNAEENSAMRRLNEPLGFRATAVVTSAVLKLTQSS
jgi:hypothetical protein